MKCGLLPPSFEDTILNICQCVSPSITCVFPKSIHTVTYEGFLLKLQAFIFAFIIQQAFID
jgi:hypothetical protein